MFSILKSKDLNDNLLFEIESVLLGDYKDQEKRHLRARQIRQQVIACFGLALRKEIYGDGSILEEASSGKR